MQGPAAPAIAIAEYSSILKTFSIRRSAISRNHHTLLILDRKHCGGMRNAHRAGTAHRLDRGLGLQESATAGRSQRGMVLGQKVEETRVVVVGEKWQFHSIN